MVRRLTLYYLKYPNFLDTTLPVLHCYVGSYIVAKTLDKYCIAYYLSLKLRLFTKQPTRRQVTLRATYHMRKNVSHMLLLPLLMKVISRA